VILAEPEDEELEGPKLPLTIYLLKPKMVPTFEREVKQGRAVQSLAKPLDGEFIVFPPAAREPVWVDVIRSVLQTPAQLGEMKGQSPAGLLVIRRDDDTFVASFGHAWQKLEDEWLESDFGLRVALNSIPPDKIIEIRAEQVFANWHIASERAPRASFVDQFGVEFDRDVVACLDGVPSNKTLFGNHVRGGTNMHVEASAAKLGEVLDKAATFFRSNAYKKRWPEIGNVRPVNDLATIEALEARLDSDFKSGEAQKKLVLFTPAHRHGEDLKLAHSYVYGRLAKNAVTRPYMLVDSWINFLKGKDRTPSTSEAKDNRIHLLDEGKEEIKNYRVYDCFGYELSFDRRPYILSSGVWYEVVPDFLSRVTVYIASYIKPAPKLVLPKWNEIQDEGEYNTRCGDLPSFLHFDCKDVMFGGGRSRFEFCDFLDTRTRTLCFAKIASKSSGMSHLVEQVRRTAELLFDPDQAYRDQLSVVFKAQHPKADRTWLKSRPKNGDWNLCLVSLGRTAKDLPFFAKCALWKLHRDLTARGHEVFFVSV
jgi:uncharacterized protein (TIGR04141 family)